MMEKFNGHAPEKLYLRKGQKPTGLVFDVYRLSNFDGINTITYHHDRVVSDLKARNAELVDVLENLIIGIGMGWDLDGLIDASKQTLLKKRR